MRRACAVLLAVLVAGCEALRPAPEPTASLRAAATKPSPPPPSAAPAAAPPAAAEGVPAAAKQVAPEDPLLLVAKCLEWADHLGAAAHLEGYVAAHPDQPLFRCQLAELYLKADRPAAARAHYERFAAEADGPALRPHAVAAHIKLMTLAQQAGDRFAELHHRGAGLLLLVRDQDGAKDRDPLFCEEMTCKALRALTDAKELRPTDPRTRELLAEALDRVGGRRAARAERAAARADVVGSGRKVLSE